MRQYKYKVATQCMTYNQKPYIEDTLNGFIIQQTSFPVVYVVVDDASNDGESVLLREWAKINLDFDDKLFACTKDMPYGDLLYAKLKNNSNAIFVILLLNDNHYQTGRNNIKLDYIREWTGQSEYYAICEGDDYWVDPQKLQKQVDFMDQHQDYVLCHTDFNLTTGRARNHSVIQSNDDNYFPQSLLGNLGIGTLTTLFRSEAYKRIPKLWENANWPMGDMQMWIELSREGKFKFFPYVTAHYRILPQSASHGTMEKEIRFVAAIREVRLFYSDYYGVELENKGYSPAFYAAMIKIAFKHQNKNLAKKYKKEATEKKMASLRMWLYYFATMIPPFGYALRKYLGR